RGVRPARSHSLRFPPHLRDACRSEALRSRLCSAAGQDDGWVTMNGEIRDFITGSTLLFIASRNAQGALDVSPRGGQPTVLRVTEAGELLLPDYRGNRRLDTIGNLLGNPEVALIVLNRGAERFLRIHGTGRVSFEESHIAAFPADESLPIS